MGGIWLTGRRITDDKPCDRVDAEVVVAWLCDDHILCKESCDGIGGHSTRDGDVDGLSGSHTIPFPLHALHITDASYGLDDPVPLHSGHL